MAETSEMQSDGASVRHGNFVNASPFPRRKMARDSGRTAVLAGALLAILAFMASMFALLLIRAPSA
ncbi:MAG: hypothetical protein ABI944_06255 [Chthoniobacterales bacterium]